MVGVLKFLSIVVLLGFGALLVVLALATSRESALGKGSLAEARAQLPGSHRLVVVAVSQRGCIPCQTMKFTTWRDGRIVQWVRSHGVTGKVVHVDADEQPKTVKELNVNATPMVVLLSEQGEIARHEGYLQADKAIKWLEQAAIVDRRNE